MADIDERLALLEQELASLRAQLASQAAAPQTAPARPASIAPASVAEEVNRRSLLRKTGAAIAGAAAGGVVLAATQASPVAAANGDPVNQGEAHTYASSLFLTGNSTNTALVVSGRSDSTNLANNGPAPLRINKQFTSNGKPTSDWGITGALGSIARSDSAADLWYCHAGSDKSSDTWGRVLTSANANFIQYLSTPQRLVNTRTTAKPADNSTNTYTLAGAPTNAVGFIGTITVTDTTSDGSYVSVYNGNLATIADPQFSHVNAGLGQTLATGLTVGLGASRSIKVYVFKSCNIIVDVAAWVVTGG
jgi:hypothetical protein